MSTIDLTRAISISGWMSRRELGWIAAQAQHCQAVIEIGSCRGRSTCAWADHLPAGGVVHAVDIWEGDEGESNYQQFQVNLADHIAAGRVVAHRGSAAAMVDLVPSHVDLVFIDGDHSAEAVERDWVMYAPRVRRGGILAGHDYNNIARHAGVRAVVDRFAPLAEHVGSIWWVVR